MSVTGWLSIAFYSCLEAFYYIKQEELFDASLSIVFIAFCLLFSLLEMKEKGESDFFRTMTKFALITSAIYFPFSEIHIFGDLLKYATAKITVMMLNIFGIDVYIKYPSFIYYTLEFHRLYRPVEIILACTAIQSIVIFTGLIFSVDAP
ncbi:MAG: archaeosortase A, partial [Candidatus Methanospirareceae archaeon]